MSHSRHPLSRQRLLVSLFAVLGATASWAGAQVIQPPYDSVYTLTDLGTIANLPTPYGGLDFLSGNPNVIVENHTVWLRITTQLRSQGEIVLRGGISSCFSLPNRPAFALTPL